MIGGVVKHPILHGLALGTLLVGIPMMITYICEGRHMAAAIRATVNFIALLVIVWCHVTSPKEV